MSLILRALEKAQKKYTDNAKAVLSQNSTTIPDSANSVHNTPDADRLGERRRSHIKLQVINTILSVIIAISIASILLLLNDRITSSINHADGKIEHILSQLQSQEDRISTLDRIPQEMNRGLDQLNNNIAAKIDRMNADLKNQQSALNSAREEILKGSKEISETRRLIQSYKLENEKLKTEVETLKQRPDTTAPVDTPQI